MAKPRYQVHCYLTNLIHTHTHTHLTSLFLHISPPYLLLFLSYLFLSTLLPSFPLLFSLHRTLPLFSFPIYPTWLFFWFYLYFINLSFFFHLSSHYFVYFPLLPFLPFFPPFHSSLSRSSTFSPSLTFPSIPVHTDFINFPSLSHILPFPLSSHPFIHIFPPFRWSSFPAPLLNPLFSPPLSAPLSTSS